MATSYRQRALDNISKRYQQDNEAKSITTSYRQRALNPTSKPKKEEQPQINASDIRKVDIRDFAIENAGGPTSAQIRRQAYLMQEEKNRIAKEQKAKEEAEWQAKTPAQKVGTVVGKTLATPIAAMGELGTGVARGFEGFLDAGITLGGVGIGAMRKRRLENSQKTLDKLVAEGKINAKKAQEWQQRIDEEKIDDQAIDKTTAEIIEYPIAENLLGKANREFSQNYSYLPTKAADISKNVGTMLPSVAAGNELMATKPLQALASTGKVGTKVASTVSMAPFMAQAAGMSTEEALRDGADLKSAAEYGALSGAVEGAIETISGGIGGIAGNKIVSKLAPATIAKISNKVIAKYLPKFLDAGIDFLGEGGEEWLSAYINPYIKRLTYDEKAELSTSEERMEAFADGMLASFLLKGTTSLAERTSPQGKVDALPEMDAATRNQLANITKNIEYQKQNEALANKQIQESVQNAKNNIGNSKTTLALPEGNRFYADEKGNVVNAQNYVAPRRQVQNQNSPVNTKQTIIDVQNNSQDDLLRRINTTLPTRAEMAQKANTEQITDMSKMPDNFMKKRPTYKVGIEKILPFMDDRMGGRENWQIEGLRESIKKNGIETPIELRTNANGEVTINDGHHRLQIAQELGIKNIPVQYLDENSQKMIELDSFEEYNTPINERWDSDVDGIGRTVSRQNQGSGITEENSTHIGTLSDRTDTATENDRLLGEVQGYNNRPSSDTTRRQDIAGQEISEADAKSAFSMPVEDILEEGIKQDKISYNDSIYRNLRRALGENGYQYVRENILDKLDAAKLDNVNMKSEITNDLKKHVVDELGIKKGSKESELVQKYGEKEITLDELKQRTSNWENVVEADKWFRSKYDELIDRINESRAEIYPYIEEKIEATELELNVVKQKIQEIKEGGIAGYKKDSKIQLQIENLKERIKSKTEFMESKKNKKTLAYKDANRIKNEAEERIAELEKLLEKRIETKLYQLETKAEKLQETLDSEELWRGKRIPKRKDYYRHFQEMAEGFEALGNILAMPSDISSGLSGVSEYTKPNAKWLGLAQKRLTNETKYDAVGGFLDYLDSASYAINIDPEIKRIRDFTEELRKVSKDNTTANRLIEYLTDYANDLAGKTNPMDRYIQKVIPGGRKTMKAISWVTNRIKSNAVLGNFNSAAAQILNIPQGLADIKSPKNIAIGFWETLTGDKDGKYKNSQFITERFNSDVYSQFNERLIDQPKKLATWLLGALDEFGTKTIWNGEYSKAVDMGIKDPTRYADYRTRDLVAGRGIGELSLNQRSKTIGLLAPFTVEVSNYWGVVKDFISAKDFGGLVLLQVFAFLFNKGLEELGVSAGVFDLIDALIDAWNTEGGIDKKAGRVAGEFLSNTMFGQQIAGLYPENGADLGFYKLPTRSELFGDADPTRMGTGSVLSKAISNPVTSVVLPWGGTQLNKTTQGLSTYAKGGSYSKDAQGNEKLKYPVEQNVGNFVKSALFGKWSTEGAKRYIDSGFKALSANQTKGYEKAKKAGISDEQFYNAYNAQKKIEGLGDLTSLVKKNEIDKATRGLSQTKRQILYETFGVAKSEWDNTRNVYPSEIRAKKEELAREKLKKKEK